MTERVENSAEGEEYVAEGEGGVAEIEEIW